MEITDSARNRMFSNKDLVRLIIPLIIEQMLTVTVGLADSIMTANVGEEAVSGVSLVDSVMVLMINLFSALATGGAVVAGQFLGQRKNIMACKTADQLILFIVSLSVVIMAGIYACKNFILNVVFGNIEPGVMHNAEIYLMIVTASIPFIAIYNGCAALFRIMGNSKISMNMSMLMNGINIAGNAILIYGFKFGVEGVAIPTLVSRIVAAVVMVRLLAKQNQDVHLSKHIHFHFKGYLIQKILHIGVPNGIENSMFQLGKLAIQSTVSTLGTTAIAAQAMTNILENLNGIGGIGVGIGLMTIVGQCLGADRKDEAVYYIKKLCVIAEIVMAASCVIVFALTKPITILGGMEPESAKMCLYMVGWITVVKPIVWTLAFIPAYGMRAAGDVRFSMILSCISMWAFRVTLCIYLCRVHGFGPIAVWIGMFTDWTIRGIVFTFRFMGRRWLAHKVV